MTTDESPADVAAHDAAPPGDGASPAAPPPDARSAPARRRSGTSRSPRARTKAAAASGETAAPATGEGQAVQAPVPPPAEAPAPQAPARQSRARRSARPPEPPPDPDEGATPPRTAAETPASPRRRPTRRSSAALATAPAEALPSVADPGPATAAPAVPAAPPAIAPAEERALLAPAAEQVPIAGAAEEPAATDGDLAAPARTRRTRSPRRGRKTAEAATLEQATAPEAAVPAVEAASAVEPAFAPAPERPARRQRAPRRKAGDAPTAPPPVARVVVRRGMPELQIREVPVAPVLFFGNAAGARQLRHVASEVARAAREGLHLHSTLVELVCPQPADDSMQEMLDARVAAILDADPQGYVLPRVVFVPATGWRQQYPDEVNHYADGTSDDPSIASDRFWLEAGHCLRSMAAHVERTTYAQNVIGYHLERGEWFHPADAGFDRSFANREAFRQWLRAKYHNSEVALRAAWYDGSVQFYTADIPPLPTNGRSELAFFGPRKERRWIDFLEFTSETTADRLVALARVVKEATQGRALVSVCYGYTFEFGHTYSGHLALGRLLADSAIDIVTGPPSYRDRQVGGAGAFPGPVDSVAVHGKLWISEDDTKTHLAPPGDDPDDFNPRIETRAATEQAQLRSMGAALAHQSGVGWMDLWGEGWLDADDIWSRIGEFSRRYERYLRLRRPQSPDVVVLVNERSLLHLQRGEDFVRRLLAGQRDAILRCGASVGFYLQNDVTARAFPTDAKLYLFLTPYRLTFEQRTAIRERLHGGGRTLVWMYAVGVCEDRGETEESAHDVTGLMLHQQSWNAEVGTRLTDTRHAITQSVTDRALGVRERLNPSFYVDDDEPGVVVLGEYQQSGLPSVAVRKMEGWSSVFIGEPTLSADLLRGLCRHAGVHLYVTGGDDYVYAGNGWVTLHATREGHRTLMVPPNRAVYDITEERLLGDDLRECRAFMRARTTRVFFIAPIEEMRKLGLRGLDAPREPLERDRPRRSAPEGVDSEAAAAPPADALEPVIPGATVTPDGLGDADDGGDEVVGATEPAGLVAGDVVKSRRRRRGGRGRGRRRAAQGTASVDGAGAPPPPEEG